MTTSDGYILSIHRIPHGRNETQNNKNPVFLGHSLVGSSAVWTFGPPENSLAFILADLGYDVWMPNMRGNSYSKSHTYLDSCTSCKEFWDFSFEESALHDYPASIDYILNQTQAEQIYFIGYSMGTTQYLILLSERPEYNDKIKMGFLLGPTAFGGNGTQFLRPVARQFETIKNIMDWMGIYEVLPDFSNNIKSRIAQNLCPANKIYSQLCSSLISLVLGIRSTDMDREVVPYYLSHVPAGASVRQFVHYSQLYLNGGRFAHYDFGAKANLERYGSVQPPDFPLGKISAPTALFSGKADILSVSQDAFKLADLIPSLMFHEEVDDPNWTHTHFIWSKRAKDILYNRIVQVMER